MRRARKRTPEQFSKKKDEALGRWMGWGGVTHVRRNHEHYHTRGGGHLYQGRFKSFPVAEDEHFLMLCRYLEANPLRAGLVERSQDRAWNRAGRRLQDDALADELLLSPWPVDRPRNRIACINAKLAEKPLEALRQCVNRGRPLGS